ncbi:DUF4283 domain-containing protein, partial [Cephalotus follicularis]
SLWTSKSFNMEVLNNIMKSLWKPKFGLRIRDIGNNLFLFQFNNEQDRMKVLELGPWWFDRHILLLDKVDVETHPSSISLHKASFCVRVYGVPFLCLSDTVVRIIRDNIGDLEEIEVTSGKKENSQYLKLRVRIDVREPLRRGMKLRIGGAEKV